MMFDEKNNFKYVLSFPCFFLWVFSSGLLLKCLRMKSINIEVGPSNINVLFKGFMLYICIV